MGKIFGISDLPVSTIMSPFEPTELSAPKYPSKSPYQYARETDKFVSITKQNKEFMGINKGLRKFLKHFTKSK